MTTELTQGKKIRIMRTIRGFNQGEFARKIGMPQVTLSYIENDHVAPTLAKMQTIKAALAWPPDDRAEAAFAILVGDGGEP